VRRSCSPRGSCTPTAFSGDHPMSKRTRLVERAAGGEATHEEVVAWIRRRTPEMQPPDDKKADGPRRLP
jgi:hypothetical protein